MKQKGKWRRITRALYELKIKLFLEQNALNYKLLDENYFIQVKYFGLCDEGKGFCWYWHQKRKAMVITRGRTALGTGDNQNGLAESTI